MEYEGICHKMRTALGETVETDRGTLAASVEYHLVLGSFDCPLTSSIGQEIELEWTGRIFCLSCGTKTPKSYSQGHCYKCLISKASCDMCMMKPETCHFHLGTCREPDWALDVCFQPHIVYLANSSAPKVGITRITQMPTRWLDQGATQALPIMQVNSRKLSGLVEVLFAQDIADKTDWRALLKGAADPIDLIAIRDQLIEKHRVELDQLQQESPHELVMLSDERIREFSYPVSHYPAKVTAHNFDKKPVIHGKLNGIKGQYLLLDTGVLNLRKFGGYELKVRV